MRIGRCAVMVWAAICVHAGVAGAQSRTMTLAEVLARARDQAPGIVSARLAVDEARGRLLGASVRFQNNPELEASVGNREGPDRRFTDFDIGLGQRFEPGARKSARVAGAEATIARSTASVDARALASETPKVALPIDGTGGAPKVPIAGTPAMPAQPVPKVCASAPPVP